MNNKPSQPESQPAAETVVTPARTIKIDVERKTETFVEPYTVVPQETQPPAADMTVPVTSRVEEIRRLHQEITDGFRITLEKAVRIGELLTQVKGGLKHGEWLPWIAVNCSFAERTARDYIRFFERREELKSANVADLGEARKLLTNVTVDNTEQFVELAKEAAQGGRQGVEGTETGLALEGQPGSETVEREQGDDDEEAAAIAEAEEAKIAAWEQQEKGVTPKGEEDEETSIVDDEVVDEDEEDEDQDQGAEQTEEQTEEQTKSRPSRIPRTKSGVCLSRAFSGMRESSRFVKPWSASSILTCGSLRSISPTLMASQNSRRRTTSLASGIN